MLFDNFIGHAPVTCHLKFYKNFDGFSFDCLVKNCQECQISCCQNFVLYSEWYLEYECINEAILLLAGVVSGMLLTIIQYGSTV